LPPSCSSFLSSGCPGLSLKELLPESLQGLETLLPTLVVAEGDRGPRRVKRFPEALAWCGGAGAGAGAGACPGAVTSRALVIGNIAYQTPIVSLTKAEQDAEDMGNLLARQGFAVSMLQNCTRADLYAAPTMGTTT
jgi:hypothetical protein